MQIILYENCIHLWPKQKYHYQIRSSNDKCTSLGTAQETKYFLMYCVPYMYVNSVFFMIFNMLVFFFRVFSVTPLKLKQ